MGWQLGICSGMVGVETITLLVQKYCGSAGLTTIEQMQQILDRICNCSSNGSNINSASSPQSSCAPNQDCSSINNVSSFIWQFIISENH